MKGYLKSQPNSLPEKIIENATISAITPAIRTIPTFLRIVLYSKYNHYQVCKLCPKQNLIFSCNVLWFELIPRIEKPAGVHSSPP